MIVLFQKSKIPIHIFTSWKIPTSTTLQDGAKKIYKFLDFFLSLILMVNSNQLFMQDEDLF